jgi:hypothetical protein
MRIALPDHPFPCPSLRSRDWRTCAVLEIRSAGRDLRVRWEEIARSAGCAGFATDILASDSVVARLATDRAGARLLPRCV